jgi:hypothetical protein
MKYVVLLCLLFSSGMAGAAVLEGVGHANIRENNIDQARAEARKAAMRDLALQFEAQVSSNDRVENGELVSSRTELSTMAEVRNASVVDEYRSGNLLRVTVRAEVSEGGASSASCKAGDASGLRKRVAVTGFPLVDPPQGGNRAVDDAGEKLPQALISRLQKQGRMQVLGASRLQLFGSPQDAPTSQRNLTSNHLTNVVQLARELGAHHFINAKKQNAVEELQKLGGAKVIVATAPNTDIIGEIAGGLGLEGNLLVLAATGETFEVSPFTLIMGRKKVSGWPSGTAKDSEDTLNFSSMTGTKPMIETYPLEKVNEAYDHMITNKARFRTVLSFK